MTGPLTKLTDHVRNDTLALFIYATIVVGIPVALLVVVELLVIYWLTGDLQ